MTNRSVLGACALALLAACTGPDPQAFWDAMAAADATAAHRAASSDRQRRCADALAAALAGGSAAATPELLAIGADDADPLQRDWARRLLLLLLRHEGEWPDLAALRQQHPELDLTANAIPAAMAKFPRAQIQPPTEASRLPWLEHESGLPIVDARLTGERGAVATPVVLDTGALICVIPDTLAERLGARFVSDEPLPLSGLAGQTSTARAAVLAELQLGAWTLRDVPAAVVPHANLRVSGHDLPALVGWEVLRHARLELSAQRREIVFDRSRAGPVPDGEANLVLLTEPLVRLRCNDASALLLVDTGCTFTLVTRGLVQRLGLATRPGGQDTLTGIAGESTVDHDLVMQLTLQCGPTRLTLGDLPAYDQKPPPSGMPRPEGALGIDVMSAVDVVIDGPARTMTMTQH